VEVKDSDGRLCFAKRGKRRGGGGGNGTLQLIFVFVFLFLVFAVLLSSLFWLGGVRSDVAVDVE